MILFFGFTNIFYIALVVFQAINQVIAHACVIHYDIVYLTAV